MPNQSLPKYVRLPDELYLGIQADLESGWSISGLDVKETPTDESDPAYKTIQTWLRQGKLEPASKAEFDHIQSHYEEMDEATGPARAGEADGVWNEPRLSGMHREARRKLVELRNKDHARRQGDDGEETEESEYASWTDTKLKEELKSRSLPIAGGKRELIARLEEDDRNNP